MTMKRDWKKWTLNDSGEESAGKSHQVWLERERERETAISGVFNFFILLLSEIKRKFILVH